MKEVSIFENIEYKNRIMSSKLSEISGLADGFELVLLIISVVFTIGVLVSLFIVFRQIMKSKWIDSNSVTVLFVLVAISAVMVMGVWVSYLLYV